MAEIDIEKKQQEKEEKLNLSSLEVRSEEVQEIIGQPPHWLIRWGITIFFGILVTLLAVSWLIKYPEIIKVPLKLTAINSPKRLNSRINGKLIKLLVGNNQTVRKGKALAFLESTAKHEEVLQLAAYTDSLSSWMEQKQMGLFKNALSVNYSHLGELQSSFQIFEKSRRQFVAYLDDGYYLRQRQALLQELDYTRSLLEQLSREKELKETDYQLAKEEYEVQKKLAEEGVIAPLELKAEESKLLSRRVPLQQIESSIINNHAAQTAKQKELMELDQQIAEQEAIFLQALNTLKSSVSEWLTRYVIVAPFEGKVIYSGILQENQQVKPDQELFYLIPDNTNYFGEASISQQSFGKIQTGQRVLVKFDGYPYQEFGSATGTVSYLSDIPVRDSVFLAKIDFENGLQTSYGKKLTPVSGMSGTAEIITQDMRLIERFYNNIRKELER